MFAFGGATVTIDVAVLVQLLFPQVAVTVQVPADVAMMLCVVAPVLHKYEVATELVNVVPLLQLPPEAVIVNGTLGMSTNKV